MVKKDNNSLMFGNLSVFTYYLCFIGLKEI